MDTLEWPQGTTHIPLARTLQDKDGDALSLSGISASAITARICPFSSTTFTALAGTAVIISASLGQITYTFASADVATPGTYQLVFVVTFGPSDVWTSFPIKFIVVATA